VDIVAFVTLTRLRLIDLRTKREQHACWYINPYANVSIY